ncbi:hypothetical protein HK096_002782, partial [Nowakowskiella sp. JEL0078]
IIPLQIRKECRLIPVESNTFSESLNPVFNSSDSLQIDHIAIALKTGSEVGVERVPIQLLTFLQDIKNIILIGDEHGYTIGPNVVHDVVSGLYEDLDIKSAIKARMVFEDPENFNMTDYPEFEIMKDITGWQRDAHKNLPAFKLLYEKFPKARWYLMIDDDTYVYFDTLLARLDEFDWSYPLYLGNKNVFRGCDGVKEFGDGPNFAHGGSGIIISQEAIKQLVKPTQFNECIARYRDCWAGDVRTSLCLRDSGIFLETLEGVQNKPITYNEVWDKPCDNPTTFHRLNSSNIQQLFSKTPYKSATNADVFNGIVKPKIPEGSLLFRDFLQDIDWPDSHPYHSIKLTKKGSEEQSQDHAEKNTEVREIVVKSNLDFAEYCKNICRFEEKKKCITWVWDGKSCWLKDGFGGEMVALSAGSMFSRNPRIRRILFFITVAFICAVGLFVISSSFRYNVSCPKNLLPIQTPNIQINASLSNGDSKPLSTQSNRGDLDAEEEEISISTDAEKLALPIFSKLKHVAFALKTGQKVAVDRVPIQLITFLRDVENLLIIGDEPGVQIGAHVMHDVYTNLYEDPEIKEAIKKRIEYENNSTHIKPDKSHLKHEIRLTRRLVPAEIIPDTASTGWKRDAHKNLPAFKLLHDRFPEARWYFMIDDDTFAYLDTLIYRLATFNWNQPLYLGVPNVFRGCDGVKKFGEGPHFAHGGSGIILSRGAIKKLVQPTHLNKCIARYRQCFAGDVRTALCLRDADILVTKLPGIHGTAPVKEQLWSNPCDTPITWHHLPVQQIQQLQTAQEEKIFERLRDQRQEAEDTDPKLNHLSKRRLPFVSILSDRYLVEDDLTTEADVFHKVIAPQLPRNDPILQEFVDDVDWPKSQSFRSIRLVDTNLEDQQDGSKLRRGILMNYGFAESCRNICRDEEHERCVTWVWDGAICWLKRGMGGKMIQKEPGSGFASGVFAKRFLCKR